MSLSVKDRGENYIINNIEIVWKSGHCLINGVTKSDK